MGSFHLEPSRFYNTFGPEHPALRVSPGDRITTRTLDAHGYDYRREKPANKDNPLTGPFYIDGAEKGDALVVNLESVLPNRTSAWSACWIAPGSVDPEYVPALPPKGYARWELDLNNRTAVLREPKTRLRERLFSWRPMLGCIGVAPGGSQSISSTTSGPYGGNMDYWGCTGGKTLYFPVFTKGALLFLGDGHALQGDGELAGSGVEVSCDVRFCLDLIKGKEIYWPRGEDDEYLFTIGNARPLSQAVQHASTEMLRWLGQDFGLTETEAGIVLGHSAHLDLGNMYDPAFTMVCRVPKTFL